MSTTLYVRFPDEATFRATLPADFKQSGETGGPLPDGVVAIRIVGAIYEYGALLIPGFHVNVLGQLPQAWRTYEVTPTFPQGVFG